jgi:catechol 2,3-dioxygenase-like lactoylglutathione lyase family enzyme
MRVRAAIGLAATMMAITMGLSLTFPSSAQEQAKIEPPKTDRPKIISISHLSVYTSDAAKAEHFYVHDLGAQKAPDPQNRSGIRYYFNAIQFVEVLPLPPGPASINRLDHVAYNTANAEAMRKFLGSQGVVVPTMVTKADDQSQYFEVADPEGNRIEFIQPPPHPAPVPDNPLSDHVIHIGYIVHDASTENSFYRALLGFRPYWHGGMKDDATDWVSQQVPDGTDWIEYMMVKGPEKTGIPPSMSGDTLGVLDHFSLGVPNMEKAVTLLYGGDRLTAKHSQAQIGRDGKWQFNLFDPDGTRVELMEFQPVGKPCCSPFSLPSPTE